MSKPKEKSSARTEPQTAEGHPTREEIELRAHQIYVERGGTHGQDGGLATSGTRATREIREDVPKGKSGCSVDSRHAR